MKKNMAFLASLAIVLALFATCSWLAVSESSLLLRLCYLGGASLCAFLIGLGYGERENGAYCQQLVTANKLLGDQTRELLEVNAQLMREDSKHGLSHEKESESRARTAPSGR